MLKENKVYVILVDFSNDDYEDTDVYLYKTRESALKKFRELITYEVEFYDNEYKDRENFEVDTNLTTNDDSEEYWWRCNCKNDFYIHTFIDFKIKELQK